MVSSLTAEPPPQPSSLFIKTVVFYSGQLDQLQEYYCTETQTYFLVVRLIILKLKSVLIRFFVNLTYVRVS